VASIGDIFLRLLLDDSDFEANVVKRATKAGDKAGQSMSAAMGKALTSFGNDAMKVGKSMTKVGDSMTRNVTVPILAAGAATGKLALDFDTTMNQIVGLAKVPREQIQGVRDEILKMAGDVGRSPQELAEAFYFVASAGFSADEAMKVLDISAKAAASGMGETQDIAKVLGGVINAYGHENLDAATAADQLTAAIQDGSAEASDFAGVIGTLAPGAAALGVSFDQVTAALAGMTNVGLSADEAATSLNQVFSGLLKPTSQAEEAMKGLGLSSAGLRQELKEKGLLATLRTLEEAFRGNDTAASAVFGNIRALRGVTALLSLDTDQLNGIFADTKDSLGAVAGAYKDTEGPQREIARSMAELQATAIEIGQDVLPIVVEVLHQLAGGAKEFAKWWSGLSETQRKTIIQFAGFLAIAGPVLSIVGRITTGVGGLTKAFGFLIKKMPLLGAAAKSALGPIGLLIAGAEGLKFGLDQVTDGELDSENAFISAAQATGDWNKAMQLTSDAMKQTGLDSRTFRDAVVTAMQDMGLSFEDAVDYVVKNGYRMTDEFKRSQDLTTQIMDHAASERADAAKMDGANIAGGVKAGIEAGTPGVAAAADGMTEEMAKAAAEAHQKVLDEFSSLLKDMTTVLTDRESFDKEWQAFIDEINNPWPDVKRRAAIESQLASKAIREGLTSEDSGVRADAIQKVNDLIAQYELLEPGALGAGKLVNPALKKGIDSNVRLAINAAQDVADKAGSAVNFEEEAGQAGFDGIQAFTDGERAAKAEAIHQAVENAKDAGRAAAEGRDEFHRSGFTAGGGFNDGVSAQKDNANRAGGKLRTAARDGASGSLYTPGYNVGQSWVDGLIAALRANRWTIAAAAGTATSGLRGKSPPKEGPLKEIDVWGHNVASAWTQAFLAAIRGMNLDGALGGMRGALAGGFASPGLSGLSVPTASTTRAAAATISAVGPTTIYQLYVNGQPREVSNSRDVMRELDTMSLFGGSGGVG
jgi:TP901 family phage tail tape measure protein